MRFALAIALVPASAAAGALDQPVIGGGNAPQGRWPDAAAVLYNVNGQIGQECSGTLIAPTVALTAGHCDPAVDSGIGTMNSVLLGTNSLARPDDGEIISVAKAISYPASQSSEDVTVIILARPAREQPRAIATGWARLDIKNGAMVELVGYGSIDKNGNTYIDDLQQATTTITDFDCSQSSGCNSAAMPAGELGAGGAGIDTCPGDSGGPMYLKTDYGWFLAGVTSRSYDNATVACSQGGIYERPDKIVAWIEKEAGVPVTHGPEPTAGMITAIHGDAGETRVDPHDPKDTGHTYALTTQPTHGMAAVRDDGRVRVCTDATASGMDSLVVTVTDSNDASRHLDVTIPIQVTDGMTPASCDVTAFSVQSGGCNVAGTGGGSLPLAIALIAILRRRRQ